jgi:uncharacterized protein
MKNLKLNRRRMLQWSAGLLAAPLVERSEFALAQAVPVPPQFSDRVQLPTRIFGNDDFPVLYRKAQPLTSISVRYPGFKPEKLLLRKGTIRRDGARALSCDIVFERDVPMTLRDGAVMYTDIFRPVGNEKVPVIIAWSPYGKQFGGQWLDDIPDRAGVPLGSVSELQKFEAPDPAYWVQHGYAIANPDTRGAYSSHGNIPVWGRQSGEDGYDFIEWCAAQHWCSGKTALAGNSWLAISQWFIAGTRPPHLTCIAPWEGLTDGYRDSLVRGGIQAPYQRDVILETFSGKGVLEDIPAMTILHPHFDEYWQDKCAPLERIEVPAYVVASYTSIFHTHGGIEGFRRISSRNKWLRIHNSNEWPDLYEESNVEDLRRFFDHYLKGVNNGWHQTPRVRMSVLDPGHDDTVNRPEQEFPLARTIYRKLYLHSSPQTLAFDAPPTPSAIRYAAVGSGPQQFLIPFDRETEISGFMNLYLWVEAEGSDDMDLDVSVMKLGADGKPPAPRGGPHAVLDSPIAHGRLRVSMREIDPKRSTPSEPYLPFVKEQRLQPGQVVPVQISIWPMSLRFHPGESLCLTIAPYVPSDTFAYKFGRAQIPIPEDVFTYLPGEKVNFKVLGGEPDPSAASYAVHPPPSRNRGTHILHVGGENASYLLVPTIPAAANSST